MTSRVKAKPPVDVWTLLDSQRISILSAAQAKQQAEKELESRVNMAVQELAEIKGEDVAGKKIELVDLEDGKLGVKLSNA